MVDPWVWAVLLVVVGLGLAVLELFIPSGGVLAFLAISSIVGGVIVGFMQGPVVGLVILCSVIVGLPVGLVLAVRWWPHTPIGRVVMLRARRSEDVLPDNPRTVGLKSLVGKVGVAKSKMLPSGAIHIEGRTVDAYSEGVPIEPGQQVMVIEVRGTRVMVRPVQEQPPGPKSAQGELSRPIDSVGPDPFEDPVA